MGDHVEFDGEVITRIFPRRSYFPRTNVANVDALIIVVAPVPKPDYLVVDKLIVEARSCGAGVAILANKCDLTTEVYDYIVKNYSTAVDEIIPYSALSGEGEPALKAYLKGKLCALAGQSAVGKTSVLNALLGTTNAVGEVSRKTNRGRHTTTGREIFFANDFAIVDTPGFSSVDILTVKSQDLSDYYADFAAATTVLRSVLRSAHPPQETLPNDQTQPERPGGEREQCYYIGCSHVSEPYCAIKQAVESGKISRDRYERYCTIYKEIKEYEKRKY